LVFLAGERRYGADKSTLFVFRRVSDRVVGAAYGVLNLADRAVDLAVALQFGVANRFADRDFRVALDLFGRSVDSVLIHGDALLLRDAGVKVYCSPKLGRDVRGAIESGNTQGKLFTCLLRY